MQITDYSILMTVLWSSILIVLFYFLRKNSRMMDVCSVSGVIALYVFVAVRLLLPTEFPGVHVVALPAIYNPFWSLVQRRVTIFGHSFVLFYVILWTLWIVVAAILLIAVLRRYFGFTRLMRRLADRDASVSAELYDEIFGGWKIRPLLLCADRYRSPVSSGILHPFILLPGKSYSDTQMRYILLHEAAHLKNNDVLVQLLINILCAVYWWNPLVYLLQRDMGRIFEFRADRSVVLRVGNKETADYLEMIKEVYKSENIEGPELRHGISLLGAQENGADLLERFEVVERSGYGGRRAGMIISILVAGILLTISYTFIFQSDFGEPEINKELNVQDGYIMHRTDGTYEMYAEGEEVMPIQTDNIDIFLDSGFTIIEESDLP